MPRSLSFKCSKCFKTIQGTPKKKWEDKHLIFTFCKDCVERMNRDPSLQFTCTGWPKDGNTN